MYCRKCGKELIEGKKFCSSCGTAIESLKPKFEEKITDNKEKTMAGVASEIRKEQKVNPNDEFVFFGNGANRELFSQIMNLVWKIATFLVGVKMVKYIFWEDHPAEIKTISSSIIRFLFRICSAFHCDRDYS